MKVDIKLIEHVADLARLNLTDSEKKKLVKELKEVLDAFSALDKIKVKDKASFQPVELKNQVREDLVEKSLSQEEALANTENKKDGYFKGPRAV
jgi:aspartyl-tRNA(Asn)/glutamyl-tRNA(Gln) amidotransferase subunit C